MVLQVAYSCCPTDMHCMPESTLGLAEVYALCFCLAFSLALALALSAVALAFLFASWYRSVTFLGPHWSLALPATVSYRDWGCRLSSASLHTTHSAIHVLPAASSAVSTAALLTASIHTE